MVSMLQLSCIVFTIGLVMGVCVNMNAAIPYLCGPNDDDSWGLTNKQAIVGKIAFVMLAAAMTGYWMGKILGDAAVGMEMTGTKHEQ